MNSFLLGVFVSRLGDSFSFLAFILILTQRGTSNAQVSLFMVAHYLPSVLFGFWGRNLFDRLPKKQSLILTYLVSAALTAIAILETSSVVSLLILSLLLGVLYGIYVPLQKAFIAEVFPLQKIKSANASVQSAEAIAKTLGFTLAGLTFHRLGPTTSFSIDAISFVAIAVLFAKITTTPVQDTSIKTPTIALTDSPELVFVSSVFALAWLGTGSLFALEAGYARTYLNASETLIGWLFGCATLGAVTAPFWIHRLTKGNGSVWPIVLACLAETVFVASYGQSSQVHVAIEWIIAYGFALTARHVLLASWIHIKIPQAQHGSAFALQQGYACFMMMLGMGLSGPISEIIGIRPVILCAAILSFAGIALLSAINTRAKTPGF